MSNSVKDPAGGLSAGPKLARALVPLVVIAAVLMMVVPIPAVGIDVLLAANLTLGILVILAVITLRDSLDFSVFPSLLLMATLIRLALNVSTTRLILLDGYAGQVVDTFGSFVVGGSVIVGLVVFLIIVIVQFVVITSGAGRVAEVAARFTLDAMPGKQMAIDADLSAGLIDEKEAQSRRERISQEADFFGAMDGASKFVKGDAIAGIVIVAINLVGGFAIGMAQMGMGFEEAISTYSLLTVGDGLVSQIPALLMSLATGLLVTRIRRGDDLGPALGIQVFGNRRALRIGAAAVALIGMLPGLPLVPFFAIAGGLYLLSTRARDGSAEGADDASSGESKGSSGQAKVEGDSDDPEALIGRMRVEPLELHLSYDILDLIDADRGGDLLERVRSLRQQIAMELGVVMPFVRTRDDVSLPQSTYSIHLHGVEVARGTAPQDRALALPAGDGTELRSLSGEETTEPVFGLQAYWIPSGARSSASATGATVVDRSAVLVTHLAEVVRASAADLLSRQQVQMLIESLRSDEPLLAGEVGTDQLTYAQLHAVLRGLLAERIPVRDIARIVEAVSTKGRETQSVEQLVGAARTAIGAQVAARVAPDRRLAVATLDPGFEAALHEQVREVDGTAHLAVDPQRQQALLEGARHAQGAAEHEDRPVAIVCSQGIRGPLRRTLAAGGVDLPVLAYPELPSSFELTQIGVIGDAHVPSS
ncbi:flagellar type III secretion system protein FlhA [Egibacter rhizosphaerae]|uniref:Flagellar type III secretion system protein FlhA n=1 Tax=Egibacter rhizosphaerae TaxID=1670831 RepID=A0A411YJG8_9ACTN|nr:flagellar biosynthesis protein FlhA [Egibacter rhizosphaerae]QBI21252.1 flagellar type III secretion system protein FlhA [Egibacter rhizosphaerae]